MTYLPNASRRLGLFVAVTASLGAIAIASCSSQPTGDGDASSAATQRAPTRVIGPIIDDPIYICRTCVGVVCNDNDPCTNDQCTCGFCIYPLKCPDADQSPCTRECNPSNGTCYAEPVNVTGVCNDGNPCTLGDSCVAGVCQPGPDVDCDDLNECTADACDTETGTCTHENEMDGVECDDGTECTAESACSEGLCAGTDGMAVCEDDNPCTVAVCDEGGACSNDPVARGIPCNTDKCLLGQTCDGAGECSGGEDLECDDGNDCTTDDCDAETGCVFEPAAGECADGNLCTVNDRCMDGECIGQDVTCADNSCKESVCEPTTGECTAEAKDDGEPCAEGAGECLDGECYGNGGAGGEGGETGQAGEGESGSGGAASTGEGGMAGEGDVVPPEGESGSAGSDAGSEAGQGGGDSASGTFKREEGGCAVTRAPGSGSAFALIAGLLGLGLVARRRARRAA